MTTTPLEENKGFKRILVASVLAHVVVTLVLLFAPKADKPVERVEIDLQQMPELEGGGGGGGGGGPQVNPPAAPQAPVAAAPAKPVAEPVEDIPSEMSYSQRRLAVKAAEPVPTASSYSERRKASKGGGGGSGSGNGTGQGTGTGSGQGTGTGTGSGSGNGNGNGDGDGNGDSMGPFHRRFWSKFKPIWLREMDRTAPGMAGTIKAQITFNRSGGVTSAKILRGSGNSAVDAAFMNALSLMPPIGALPNGKAQYVHVGSYEQYQTKGES